MNERTIVFGEGGGLIGTLCLPQTAPSSPALGQVLFNAGVVHRVGPHRINVRLARALAKRGIPSIRFDLAGLGDSPRSAQGRDFEAQAVVDLKSAMDTLGREAGVGHFALFGFCSGGPHSYATAQADERVAGLLLYDAYIFPTIRSRINRYLRSIQRKGLFPAVGGWLGRLPGHLRKRAAGENEGMATGFRIPSRAEFARTLGVLHERGTSVRVMYSGGFRELYNYAEQFEDVFGATGVTRYVSCEYLPDMDHTATQIAAQAEFMQRIEAWVVELDERCRGAAR